MFSFTDKTPDPSTLCPCLQCGREAATQEYVAVKRANGALLSWMMARYQNAGRGTPDIAGDISVLAEAISKLDRAVIGMGWVCDLCEKELEGIG